MVLKLSDGENYIMPMLRGVSYLALLLLHTLIKFNQTPKSWFQYDLFYLNKQNVYGRYAWLLYIHGCLLLEAIYTLFVVIILDGEQGINHLQPHRIHIVWLNIWDSFWPGHRKGSGLGTNSFVYSFIYQLYGLFTLSSFIV